MMIDNGISQISFTNNEYTFWKFRYAEQAINFWVERGDYHYNVSEDLDYANYQYLQQIAIMGGSKIIPDIADNIGNYTACSFGLKLEPEELTLYYDKYQDAIMIFTIAGKR